MSTRLAALAALALGLSGCMTAGGVKAMRDATGASGVSDPACYEMVKADLAPLILPWGPVPFVTGSYARVCHQELKPPTP